jgi:hypothetical protein
MCVCADAVAFGVERVETPDEVGTGAIEQGTVVPLDHPHARAHDPGQRQDRHASTACAASPFRHA